MILVQLSMTRKESNMDNNEYKCDICGNTVNGLDSYVKHVKLCADSKKARLQAKKEKEYLDQLNAAINKVKQAKSYYRDCLKEFREKYPKEYEVNFGERNCEDHSCKTDKTTSNDKTTRTDYSDNEKAVLEMLRLFGLA